MAVEGSCLCISDTGIGIAPEDLPRIFETGYTGGNGRLERSASHLGLYLTHKAADLLPIPVRVESRRGTGNHIYPVSGAGARGNSGIKKRAFRLVFYVFCFCTGVLVSRLLRNTTKRS